ncbi:unnamed protein product (macronuclear) [Paramecium tetraurelia]|uniref:RING-type domain-containing protein n=1 Tax=Paramecium tetraurelia TaxID=5888 RepID=A0ECU4_PARTE|nr:uncharacterized protein GSPATT00003980001 [Paramecium tetraurelia]CAK93111.1 unnamed protein product [Paramecium tetraurelia]|eukprot:XP_001460508.1 hypothetical protein (macronuclear) [Paramecium tetraurelia strain d4-2]
MNYQFEIIKQIWASKKIWAFFKYQNLLNQRIKELIQELDPKIQTVIQLKEKKQLIGISNRQFTTACTKALENKANLLKPLFMLNKRNIQNNQKYLIDILQIIHYSTQNEESNYVQDTIMNPNKIKEQKQLYQILELIFVMLQNQQRETTKYQILICLDSILKQLMKCSQQNPEILQQLIRFQQYNRSISYKKSYEGIGQYIKAITSFDCKLKPDLSPEAIDSTLNNVLQQLDCVICYSAMKDPVSLKCGHSFCKKCRAQDQNNSQKCPMCRVEQVDDIYLSENNKFLIKLIQLRLNFEKKNNIYQEEYQQIYIKPQSKETYEQKLVLRTLQSLKYLIEEEVEIDTKRFKTLSTLQFQQLIKQHLTFILIDKNENAYLVKNILTYISKNKTRIKVQYYDKIKIAQYHLLEIALNQENGEYIFESEFATAITYQDEYIDVNNIENQKQISLLINSIKEFFNQAFLNQQQDQTQQTISSFLAQQGFLMLHNSDIISNYDDMRKYSYLVPNLLRIPEKERVEIQQMNNLIKRLELIQKSLNRFRSCSNLLMILQIHYENHSLRRNTIIFTIICLVLLFFVLL